MDDRLGKRYGNYLIERLIGVGGMGAVYAAVQPDIGKQVAVKFLDARISESQGGIQRFFAEARAVNLIGHDNIVDIFDYGNTPGGESYFVMELLRGCSLEAALSTTRFSVARALDVAVQIADALSSAHEHGIIHRDLKPDNCFLVDKRGRNDFVKLLDFGIAKLSEPPVGMKTLAGTVLGTPGYMSPEQATGSRVDARTDVYALGVVLFRMLTGRLPFMGASLAEILPLQLTETAPKVAALSPEVPPVVSQLVDRMLSRELAGRPRQMSEVSSVLVTAAAGALSAARASSVPHSEQVALGTATAPRTTLSSATGQRALVEPRVPAPTAPLAVILAGLGVASIGVWGWTHGHSSSTSGVTAGTGAVTSVAKPSGRKVLIETVPPGAMIEISGKRSGPSPIEIVVPDGHAQAWVVLDGYEAERVELKADAPYTRVRLRPLRTRPKKNEHREKPPAMPSLLPAYPGEQ